MLQDIHSHTYYSYCGKDSPEDIIKNAISHGLDLVGISDHYYGIVMNKPGFVYEDDDARIHMHNNAVKRYFDHIKTLTEKYKDYIDVWCGVEITTIDWGYTLTPDGVDVSMFDYCLIENIQREDAIVSDVFEFAKRCGCKRTGLAHMDLFDYIAARGFDRDLFLQKMKDNNIFWELNVNYDSIHNYKEHKYVNDFFENEDLINIVKNSGITLSVGFDGHRLEDYDADRVTGACRELERYCIPLIK